jgi:hypothetical protein
MPTDFGGAGKTALDLAGVRPVQAAGIQRASLEAINGGRALLDQSRGFARAAEKSKPYVYLDPIRSVQSTLDYGRPASGVGCPVLRLEWNRCGYCGDQVPRTPARLQGY